MNLLTLPAAGKIKGNMQGGYFGLVDSSSFITPAALTAAVALTAGTAQNQNSPWMMFAYKGKILYISKLPIRYGLTHSDLQAKGLLIGTTQVVINNKTFKVRAINGSNNVSAIPNITVEDATSLCLNTEYNDLLYRVNSNGGFSGVERWASFSDAEMGMSGYNNGSGTICKERENATYNLFRGQSTGLKSAHRGDFSGKPNARGWRPVLEQI